MKRLLAVILVAVLLTGCAQQEPETAETTRDTLPVVQGRQLYDPSHALEDMTGGAVRVYPLSEGCTGMVPMGKSLLLVFRGEEKSRLVKLGRNDGVVLAEVELEGSTDCASSVFAAADQSVTCYDAARNVLVLMNGQLKLLTQIACPQDVEGSPVLSPAGDKLYYCVGSDIREYDVRSGQNRLLKSHTVVSQELIGSCFDGAMLLCRAEEMDGDVHTFFLSTETGETVGKDSAYLSLQTYADSYVYERMEGSVREILVGSRDGQMQALTVSSPAAAVFGCLELGGVVSAQEQPGVGTVLEFYALDSGKKTASVILNGVEKIQTMHADSHGIWILAGDGQPTLYCWDIQKSKTGNDTIYTGKRYTADDPDTQRLEMLSEQARALGERAGLQIHVWNEAVEQTGVYAMEPAFHAEAISDGLEQLAGAIDQYPEDFFRILGNGTGEGTLEVALVRSIDGGYDGVQFWTEHGACISLCNGENVAGCFHRELSHVLDSFIIARSRAYDGWEALNPADFAYDMTYDIHADREASSYLQDADRAFISSYAMTYPREDRALILEYAMKDGCESYFTSPTMQNKLATVCKGIREAFGWEQVEGTFLWEQYLV